MIAFISTRSLGTTIIIMWIIICERKNVALSTQAALVALPLTFSSLSQLLWLLYPRVSLVLLTFPAQDLFRLKKLIDEDERADDTTAEAVVVAAAVVIAVIEAAGKFICLGGGGGGFATRRCAAA